MLPAQHHSTVTLKPLWLLALLTGSAAPAMAAQLAQSTPGFLDGATLEVLSRNFYLNNDYRTPDTGRQKLQTGMGPGLHRLVRVRLHPPARSA